jgi:hypothetical protein
MLTNPSTPFPFLALMFFSPLQPEFDMTDKFVLTELLCQLTEQTTEAVVISSVKQLLYESIN